MLHVFDQNGVIEYVNEHRYEIQDVNMPELAMMLIYIRRPSAGSKKRHNR